MEGIDENDCAYHILYPCDECDRQNQNRLFMENDLKYVKTYSGEKLLVCDNHYIFLKETVERFRHDQLMFKKYDKLKQRKTLEIL